MLFHCRMFHYNSPNLYYFYYVLYGASFSWFLWYFVCLICFAFFVVHTRTTKISWVHKTFISYTKYLFFLFTLQPNNYNEEMALYRSYKSLSVTRSDAVKNFNFARSIYISRLSTFLSPFCTFWRKYRSNEGHNFAAVPVRSSSSLPISELSLIDNVTEWLCEVSRQ